MSILNEKSYVVCKQIENLEFTVANVLKEFLHQFSIVDQDDILISARDKKLISNFICLSGYVERFENENDIFEYENLSEDQFNELLNSNLIASNAYSEIIETLNIDFNLFKELLNSALDLFVIDKHEDVFIGSSHYLAQFMVNNYHNMNFNDKISLKNDKSLYGFKILKRNLPLVTKVNSLIINSHLNGIFELIDYALKNLKKTSNFDQFYQEYCEDNNLKFIIKYIFKDIELKGLDNRKIRFFINKFKKAAKNYLVNKTYEIDYLINQYDYVLITEFEKNNFLKTTDFIINNFVISHNDYVHFSFLKRFTEVYGFSTSIIFEGSPIYQMIQKTYNDFVTNKSELSFNKYCETISEISLKLNKERKKLNKIDLNDDNKSNKIIDLLVSENSEFTIKNSNGNKEYYCSIHNLFWVENVLCIVNSIMNDEYLWYVFNNLSKANLVFFVSYDNNLKILFRDYLCHETQLIKEENIEKVLTIIDQIKKLN
ncbi:hypothetical protein OBK22_09065 [Empedobacter falsenii]|uniref:hypothetical protein n=1 Tax=Empedobacter sp. TaxID=1927715 RepID=UPI00289D0C03|nr:hypothetical protein [Empedobacter sp.]